MSSTTLSRLVFAPPLHLATRLVLPFAFAINLLSDISSYIIKLSYLAREFVSAIKPSVRSFICLNVFQHYFLLAFAFLPSLPPLSPSFSLRAPRFPSSSRSSSTGFVSSFFFFFNFIQTRVSPYLRRHFAACLKATKARTRDYEIAHPIVSPRLASHAKLFCARRRTAAARRDARESAEPAL